MSTEPSGLSQYDSLQIVCCREIIANTFDVIDLADYSIAGSLGAPLPVFTGRPFEQIQAVGYSIFKEKR